MLFDLVVSENKFSLICLTFTGTLNQLHFTLSFMFTSFRTISYFSFLISLFYGACLLACLQAKLGNTYFYVNFTAGKPSVKLLLQTAVTVGFGFCRKKARVTTLVRRCCAGAPWRACSSLYSGEL